MKEDMRWRSFRDAGNILFSDPGGFHECIHFVIMHKARLLEFVHFYVRFALIKRN